MSTQDWDWRNRSVVLGTRIITSDLMVERVLYARSPSRSRRRAKRGFPQHYVTRPCRDVLKMPNGDMVMHPAVEIDLRKEIAAQAARQMERVFTQGLAAAKERG